MSNRFEPGEYVVYRSHGVGRIAAVEEQEIAGSRILLLVVEFPRDGMTVRIPEARISASGLRRLSSHKDMEAALSVLSQPRRKASAPWMRQVRILEEKIKTGDPKAAAEVVRDLNADSANGTVRRLYQTAMDRLVQELALVEGIDARAAQLRVEARSDVPTGAGGG